MSQAVLNRLDPAVAQRSVLDFFKTLQWEPVKSEPVKSEPVQSEPVQSELTPTPTIATAVAPTAVNLSDTVGQFFTAMNWAAPAPPAESRPAAKAANSETMPEPKTVDLKAVDLNAIADLLSFEAAQANNAAAVSSLQDDDCSLADFSDFF